MTRRRTPEIGPTPTRPSTDEEQRRPQPGDQCGCGAERLGSGRCKDTGDWPRYVWRYEGKDRFTLSVPCPYACPFCGQPLQWDGGCHECHGTVTTWDKATWTFPGDRYERDGAHWVKVDGPRSACTPEENREGFKALKELLAKIGSTPPSGAPR